MSGIATSSTTASGRNALEQAVERLAAVGGELDLVGLEPQRPLESSAHRRLVIDHQDARHCT